MTPPLLDILIPAYKIRYLGRTLESLARQTDVRFSLFVFDDASPEAVETAIAPYRTRLNLRYHRFAENLGGRHLGLHYNRCVERSQAPWVWLIADDDLAGPECVAAFYRRLEAGAQADVLRFDAVLIDEHERCLRVLPPQPAGETSAEFVLQRCRRQRWNFLSNHIFSRAAFDREGGFIDFPLGWHSDDASWTAFARLTGFAAIEGARVSWRLSSDHISGRTDRESCLQKAMASFQYHAWLTRFLTDMPGIAAQEARAALPRYLDSQLFITAAPAYLDNVIRLARPYAAARHTGWLRAAVILGVLGGARRCYDWLIPIRAWTSARRPSGPHPGMPEAT